MKTFRKIINDKVDKELYGEMLKKDGSFKPSNYKGDCGVFQRYGQEPGLSLFDDSLKLFQQVFKSGFVADNINYMKYSQDPKKHLCINVDKNSIGFRKPDFGQTIDFKIDFNLKEFAKYVKDEEFYKNLAIFEKKKDVKNKDKPQQAIQFVGIQQADVQDKKEQEQANDNVIPKSTTDGIATIASMISDNLELLKLFEKNPELFNKILKQKVKEEKLEKAEDALKDAFKDKQNPDYNTRKDAMLEYMSISNDNNKKNEVKLETILAICGDNNKNAINSIFNSIIKEKYTDKAAEKLM